MAEMRLEGVADAERALSRKFNVAGTALIALAFSAPALGTAFGLGNAFSVGEDFARTLGSLLLLAGVSWLVTRGRSELAKSKGRLVVGVLLCITVGNNIATAAQQGRVAKEFLRGAIDFQAKHELKVTDLGKRFEEITVGQYVTPQALTPSALNVPAQPTSLSMACAMPVTRPTQSARSVPLP